MYYFNEPYLHPTGGSGRPSVTPASRGTTLVGRANANLSHAHNYLKITKLIPLIRNRDAKIDENMNTLFIPAILLNIHQSVEHWVMSHRITHDTKRQEKHYPNYSHVSDQYLEVVVGKSS